VKVGRQTRAPKEILCIRRARRLGTALCRASATSFVATVKDAIPGGSVKRGEVVKAPVHRAHREGAPPRPTAATSSSTRHAAVLIKPDNDPRGNGASSARSAGSCGRSAS